MVRNREVWESMTYLQFCSVWWSFWLYTATRSVGWTPDSFGSKSPDYHDTSGETCCALPFVCWFCLPNANKKHQTTSIFLLDGDRWTPSKFWSFQRKLLRCLNMFDAYQKWLTLPFQSHFGVLGFDATCIMFGIKNRRTAKRSRFVHTKSKISTSGIATPIISNLGVSWNGGTPTHPFLDGIFHHKPTSYWGTPMVMETTIFQLIIIFPTKKYHEDHLKASPCHGCHIWV